MSSKAVYDEKGKVRPRPQREEAQSVKQHNQPDLAQAQQRPDAATVQQMQQAVGNAAVQRFLAQRQGDGPTELDEETAASIQAGRGRGQQLDPEMAEKAGQATGQDFDDVTVHTDVGADELSRDLGAKAFTTGKDIYFREGAYDPASSDGQRLIAHELTHVAQQGGSASTVQGKMVVNDPDDQFEAEADRVANAMLSQETAAVQRQELDEEEEEPVQMQAEEEEVEEEEVL